MPAFNKKVMAANGAVVEDSNFRTGRRVLRLDGKVSAEGAKTRKTKVRKRGRKETAAQELVYHPLLYATTRPCSGCFAPPWRPKSDGEEPVVRLP